VVSHTVNDSRSCRRLHEYVAHKHKTREGNFVVLRYFDSIILNLLINYPPKCCIGLRTNISFETFDIYTYCNLSSIGRPKDIC